jgi:CRISPR system Cascade subunit CasA
LQSGHTFNLISASWLPVIRASGRRERIQPAGLTDDIDADPVRDLDFPRADFRCAVLEFLIGLLTVAYPPSDDWLVRWKSPPSRATLEAAFAPFAALFTFDGEGPRAFQDLENLSAEQTRVEALLLEAPGVSTEENNAALLVKAGRFEVMSRSAAAIALLTLQTMAPSGGSGHRTSLRGGGPLTTLVVPKRPATLWHRLWANVPPSGPPPRPAELPRIFPWLAPTRLSNEEGRTTTPEDVDWRQAFFGMPRRIRLNFEPNVDRRLCDLTGEIDDVIVRTYRTLKHGTKYDNSWGGIHPLTPHSRKAGDPIRYPVHSKDGRLGYRQWVAMLYGAKDGSREPAQCVSLFVAARADDLPRGDRSFRLMAAGYVMDKMKARAFTEAETPDIVIPHGNSEAVAEKAKNFVAAANEVAKSLSQAVKIALYGEDADKRIKRLNDTTPLTTARDRFWADTNDRFFAFLNDFSMLPAVNLAGDAAARIAQTWRTVMERAALAIFDDMAPVQDALSPDVKRVVEGRRFLVLMLLGYGPRGVELFKNLQLPVPETKTKTRKGKAA